MNEHLVGMFVSFTLVYCNHKNGMLKAFTEGITIEEVKPTPKLD